MNFVGNEYEERTLHMKLYRGIAKYRVLIVFMLNLWADSLVRLYGDSGKGGPDLSSSENESYSNRFRLSPPVSAC